VGRPYGVGGPLGEGSDGRYDQDALYRFDTFDCTTFVETLVSLALSRSTDEFEHRMNDIRYRKGEIEFFTRNHFAEAQWVPYNVESGLFRVINLDVAPMEELKVSTAAINMPNWVRKFKLSDLRVPLATEDMKELLLDELHERADELSVVDVALEYIPIKFLVDHPSRLELIPNGTVVNFVRVDWNLTEVIGTPLIISHQGMVFRKQGEIVLRHASNSGDQKVTEIRLIDYLKRYTDHSTLKGVHLLRLN
jgi:Protein of unknown function (DUF1460)